MSRKRSASHLDDASPHNSDNDSESDCEEEEGSSRSGNEEDDSDDEPESDEDFDLECPICLEEMEEPHLLHCGHNLCAVCAPKTQSVGRGSTVVATCPLCRHKSSAPTAIGFPVNFALKETVQKAKKLKARYIEANKREEEEDKPHELTIQ